MRALAILTVMFFIKLSELTGQTESTNKVFVKAENLFSHHSYSAALPLYQELLKNEFSNAYLNYKIGVCYLNSRSQKTEAAFYLEKSVTLSDGDIVEDNLGNLSQGPSSLYSSGKNDKQLAQAAIPLIVYKYLGDAYRINYEFDSAIKYYEKYKKQLSSGNLDQLIKEKINIEIQDCKFGKELKGLRNIDLNFKGENKIRTNGQLFNSLTPLTISPPSQFFKPNKLKTDRIFFEPVASSNKTDSLIMSGLVGKRNCSKINDSAALCNEATVGTSTDGQIVLTYRVNKGVGSLYASSLNNNQWTAPEKLAKMSNLKGWEPNEYISADGTVLYFSSDRPGGYGGKDIYKSKKELNGEWGKAYNLGPIINTPFDEEAPLIFPDGVTLYFCSNGHKTIGCHDIFVSTFNDREVWTSPAHVGYPVDATYDDLVETASVKNNSINGNGSNENVVETQDYGKKNFIVTFYNSEKASLNLIKREVVDIKGDPLKDIKITITDNETGEISAVYYSGNNMGNYLFILPKEKNNNISYEAKGYIFQSEHIDISNSINYYEIYKSVQMRPAIEGERILLNNIFFDSKRAELRSDSNVELDKLISFFNENPGIKVQISGYVLKGNQKENKKLAQERAEALANYLIKNGINKEQLTSKGYGKAKRKIIKTGVAEWIELKIESEN
ncbi:MAG: OmpA family protein [Bacteroidota bacterium]